MPRLWKKSWRDGVRDRVESSAPSTEKARRRLGFKLMLEGVRPIQSENPGERLCHAVKLAGVLLMVAMFLAGIGVVRSLITEFSYEEFKMISAVTGKEVVDTNDSIMMESVVVSAKGFNVWITLAVALGIQWCFLLVGVTGYWLWRRWSGSLSTIESGLFWLVKKLSGEKIDSDVWGRMKGRIRGGRSVFSWRLTRLIQVGGIGYNFGLLAGLFGCLWFMNVGYFWETSLPQFGEESLNEVTQVMWIPAGDQFPGERAVEMTRLGYAPDAKEFADVLGGGVVPRQQVNLNWSMFFVLSLSAYGLLPRILMWLGAWWMERKALANLDFQEAHHRTLWRDVTKVSRGEISSTPADGVVVLDMGGLEIETEELRPYFLQELRANPEARYILGTLDQEGEAKAFQAARDAAVGVVFLVEGWNLSPRQMAVYHTQVRETIGAQNMIRYLVLGSDEEMKQWTSFVDSLKDSEADIFQYSSTKFDDSNNTH